MSAILSLSINELGEKKEVLSPLQV